MNVNEKEITLEFNEENFDKLKKECTSLIHANMRLRKDLGDKNREVWKYEAQLSEQIQLNERLSAELKQINTNIANLLDSFCKIGTVTFTDISKHKTIH